MLQMGFSRDEIGEALTNNRYDEVMATYLLLDEKRQKLTVSNWTLPFNMLKKIAQTFKPDFFLAFFSTIAKIGAHLQGYLVNLLNLLHRNISKHILHVVLYTFL